MKRLLITLAAYIWAVSGTACAATLPSLSISPSYVEQGDPVMITISGTSSLPVESSPKIFFFIYQNKPTALYGTDIDQKTGTTTVSVTFKNGLQASGSFFIAPRIKPEEALPIPQSLGGNSVANQAQVLTELAKDNASLAAVYSRTDKKLWTSAFAYPIAGPVIVTDPYGYNRDSGAETITHKGVDFRAPPGTPVYAVNRGVVRVARTYTIYGGTVIVDHGLDLLSMYMHLSKIYVNPGQLVQKGQLVGLSGETGYSEGPHLHLTVRIGGISIDPMQFFSLFKS